MDDSHLIPGHDSMGELVNERFVVDPMYRYVVVNYAVAMLTWQVLTLPASDDTVLVIRKWATDETIEYAREAFSHYTETEWSS